MPLTLPQARAILDTRLGNWLDLAGLPRATDPSQPNHALDPAIAAGAEVAGVVVADLTSPTDAELAAVPDGSRRLVLDVAELEALRSIRSNWTKVTSALEGLSKNTSDLLRLLEGAIVAKEAQVAAALAARAEAAAAGVGVAVVEGGLMSLGALEPSDSSGEW